MRGGRHFSPSAIGRHAALLTTGGLTLAPFLWMVSLSAKSPSEIFEPGFFLLPRHWYVWQNYSEALTAAPLLRFLLNGAIVCTCILALQLLICVPIAYALAKLRFRGRGPLFSVVLLTLLLPHQVLALPIFILCHKLGILNSYAALILPFVVSPLGIFLFRQFFRTIPDDVIYAARLDGLSEFSIVWRIVIPMSMPAVIAFSILSVVLHWNDLFWPSIVIKTTRLMPPSLGVAAFRGIESGSDYGPLMAGAVIVVLPLLIGFWLAQRWFIEGLTSAAIK
jgi:multiple sugar transport system permease protein